VPRSIPIVFAIVAVCLLVRKPESLYSRFGGSSSAAYRHRL
jgi:hypothetical protein